MRSASQILYQMELRLTIRSPLVHIRLHRFVAILCAEMTLCREQELNVLLGRGEGRGTLVDGHCGDVE